MAHNVSAQKRAAWVRANSLSLYAGHTLHVTCASCRRVAVLRVDTLLPELHGERTVGNVVLRLRCRACPEAGLPRAVSMVGWGLNEIIWGPGIA